MGNGISDWISDGRSHSGEGEAENDKDDVGLHAGGIIEEELV